MKLVSKTSSPSNNHHPKASLCQKRIYCFILLFTICSANVHEQKQHKHLSKHPTFNQTTIEALKSNDNNNELNVNKMSLVTRSTTTSATTIADLNERFAFGNEIATKYLWPVVPIVFLIVGTIANTLSIIVFTRKEMRKFSSFCYFAMLNIVNLAFLYVTFLRSIMDYNFATDIRIMSLFVCKTHVFLTYFLSHLSSILLCTISIDRVISVMFIRQAKDLCTPKVAFTVTLCLACFNFFLSSHILILESGYVDFQYKTNLTTLSNSNNNTNSSISFSNEYQSLNDNLTKSFLVFEKKVVCDAKVKSSYHYFLVTVWKIIDMSIYAFIPFIIMLVCSGIIILRVAQQSNKFKKPLSLKNSKMPNKSDAEYSQVGNLSGNKAAVNPQGKIVMKTLSISKNDNKFNSKTRNLAMMLIPVNILFIIFIAPVVITIYIYDNLAHDHLTLALVEFLSYCNFTLNFFIYFFTSSKFREEFFKFLDENCGFFKILKKNENVASKTAATSFKCIRGNKRKLLFKSGGGVAGRKAKANETIALVNKERQSAGLNKYTQLSKTDVNVKKENSSTNESS